MNYPSWLVRGRSQLGCGLPRADVIELEGVRTWQFTGPGGTVRMASSRGLEEALAGVQLGELVVDGTNARALLDRITAMDQKATRAQNLLRDNAAAAAPFGLAATVASWFKSRDATRPKVDQVAAAAQKAVILGTPQSAPDDGIAALNDLETRMNDIDETVSTIMAQLPAGGGLVTLPPATVIPSTGFSLPWWAWALIGVGGLGLLALLFMPPRTEGAVIVS